MNLSLHAVVRRAKEVYKWLKANQEELKLFCIIFNIVEPIIKIFF
jgi:hypothetical protein